MDPSVGDVDSHILSGRVVLPSETSRKDQEHPLTIFSPSQVSVHRRRVQVRGSLRSSLE